MGLLYTPPPNKHADQDSRMATVQQPHAQAANHSTTQNCQKITHHRSGNMHNMACTGYRQAGPVSPGGQQSHAVQLKCCQQVHAQTVARDSTLTLHEGRRY